MKINANRLKYIAWDIEAEKHKISPQEYNEFFDTLDASKEIDPNDRKNTVRTWWRVGSWSFKTDSRGKPVLYYCDNKCKFHIYTIEEEGGFEAKRILVNKMKQNNGKAIQARFGTVEPKYVQQIHDINRCNGPLIGSKYSNNIELENVYKADVKSAYPYNALTDIPDWHTAQEVKGYIKPTEEWPVVYYLNSHHIAEYGKYDTHIDCWSSLFKEYRNTTRPNYTSYKHESAIGFERVPEDEEVCIKCKYSKYDWYEFQEFFDLKENGDENAKSVMNFSIGTLDFVIMDETKSKVKQDSNYEYFGHIRAVILARHNHNMIQYYKEIAARGYKFIAVQTDSMMWQGGPLDCVVETSNIGDFHGEIAAGRLYCHGCGAYWIEDEHNRIEKHQSIKGFPEINSYEEFKAFFEKTKEFIGVQESFNKTTRKFEEEQIYYGI